MGLSRPRHAEPRHATPGREADAAAAAQFPDSLDPVEAGEVKAWELVDAAAGRYMPRRIRGSFRGRALG